MKDHPKARVSMPPLTEEERLHGAHDDRSNHEHNRPVRRGFRAQKRVMNPSKLRHSYIDSTLVEAGRHDAVPDPDFIKSDVTRFDPTLAIGISIVCLLVLVCLALLLL